MGQDFENITGRDVAYMFGYGEEYDEGKRLQQHKIAESEKKLQEIKEWITKLN